MGIFSKRVSERPGLARCRSTLTASSNGRAETTPARSRSGTPFRFTLSDDGHDNTHLMRGNDPPRQSVGGEEDALTPSGSSKSGPMSRNRNDHAIGERPQLGRET